jgi:hypothetical protein
MNLSVAEIQKVIAEKIPDGLVVPEHSEQGHFYRHVPTNLLFSSVTTKTSALNEGGKKLQVWAARLGVERLTERLLATPHVLDTSKIGHADILETYQKEAVLVHQDKFEDAGGIGTIGHGYIEDYLKDWIRTGVKPEKDIESYIKEDEDYRAWAIARSAKLFIDDFYLIPIASELFVASVKHKYAGTLDGLALVIIGAGKCSEVRHEWMNASTRNPYKVICRHCNKEAEYKFTLIDWKTSNSLSKVAYVLQVSAYWEAFKEMTGLKTQELIIIQLSKEKEKYDAVKIVNQSKAFKIFSYVVKVYDYLWDGEQKMVPCVPKEIISL